jgi:hypothetical protein
MDVRRIPRGVPANGRCQAKDPAKTATAIEVLTLLNDRRYSTGAKRRSHLLQVVHTELNRLFGSLPNIGAKDSKGAYRLIDFATRGNLRRRWKTKPRWSLTPRISRRKAATATRSCSWTPS